MATSAKLTNLQLELIKMFSFQLNEIQLIEKIRKEKKEKNASETLCTRSRRRFLHGVYCFKT